MTDDRPTLGAAPASRLDGSGRGAGWVVGQSLLMTAVVVTGVVWRNQWYSVGTFVVGVLLFATGGIIGVLGVIHLGRSRTPFPRPLPDGMLVESGVYGAVRHPLYTSVILASLGWAGVWSSGPAIVLAVLLAWFMNRKAEREEQWLREQYAGYAAYAQRVKRFVPYVY